MGTLFSPQFVCKSRNILNSKVYFGTLMCMRVYDAGSEPRAGGRAQDSASPGGPGDTRAPHARTPL